MRPAEYLRSLIRPWNAVLAAILAVGLPVTFLRFTHGLSAVTHLSDANPWGIWIGIDVLCGVALAAGSPRAPRCESCHGAHNIRRLSDPLSPGPLHL